MSSNGFLLSLDIDRRTCQRVSVLVLCGAVLAIVAVTLSGLAWQVQILAAATTLACGLGQAWRAWPGSMGYVSLIHVTAEGGFVLCRVGSPMPEPAMLSHWWALPGIAIGLGFVDMAGQSAQAIVFRDRMLPAVWRLLQVRLRHGVQPVSGQVGTPVRV